MEILYKTQIGTLYFHCLKLKIFLRSLRWKNWNIFHSFLYSWFLDHKMHLST